MTKVNINRENVARYFVSAPFEVLDGFWFALCDKLAELGLVENKRAALSPGRQPNPGCCGAGIFRWIASLDEDTTEDEKAALIALHATLRNRFAAAGYEPVRPERRE